MSTEQTGPPPNSRTEYRTAEAWVAELVASGLALAKIDQICASDPMLRRLARHLWVRHQLDRMSVDQLACEVGVSSRTIRRWAAPDAAVCACGAAIRTPSAAACDRCARDARIRWTRQELICERERFHERYGRLPISSDWNATKHPLRSAGWPPVATVRRRFGSWAAFLSADQ